MKRKTRIIPLHWGFEYIEFYVRTNHNVPIVGLLYSDFVITEKLYNRVVGIFSCTCYENGFYRLMFDRCLPGEIRIKKHGFSTPFKKLKL